MLFFIKTSPPNSFHKLKSMLPSSDSSEGGVIETGSFGSVGWYIQFGLGVRQFKCDVNALGFL